MNRSWNDTDLCFYYFKNGNYYEDLEYNKQVGKECFNWSNSQQFTGLEDKNGVKIFEGDHLRDDYSDDDGNVIESSVKVIWDNENAQWAIDNSFKQDGSSFTNLVDYLGFDNLEVVSNG